MAFATFATFDRVRIELPKFLWDEYHLIPCLACGQMLANEKALEAHLRWNPDHAPETQFQNGSVGHKDEEAGKEGR